MVKVYFTVGNDALRRDILEWTATEAKGCWAIRLCILPSLRGSQEMFSLSETLVENREYINPNSPVWLECF